MWRISKVVLLMAPAAAAPVGCGPAVPSEELGTIVYEVPAVPGSEQPYQLPDLGDAQTAADAAASAPRP